MKWRASVYPLYKGGSYPRLEWRASVHCSEPNLKRSSNNIRKTRAVQKSKRRYHLLTLPQIDFSIALQRYTIYSKSPTADRKEDNKTRSKSRGRAHTNSSLAELEPTPTRRQSKIYQELRQKHEAQTTKLKGQINCLSRTNEKWGRRGRRRGKVRRAN